MKQVGFAAMRVLVFAFGLAFPFVDVVWKIVLLAVSFAFRIVDADSRHKWINATSLFFIALIIAYACKLLAE